MSKGKRLLFVDDDPQISWGVGRCLTRAGYNIVTCGNGAEAIEILKNKPVDILITDIQMPKLNGLALIEWVAKNKPAIRVAVITAFGSPTVQQAAMRMGAILYLEKPFDPQVLIEMLSPTKARNTFFGSVDSIDLFDYVQLVFVTKKQLVLMVYSEYKEGLLFIKDGTCCHAICGNLTGLEGFYACMAFNGGAFKTLPWREPEAITINQKGDFLLMDAARVKDETGRIDISTFSNAENEEEVAVGLEEDKF